MRERKVKQAENSKLKTKSEELQRLKFGQLVNLEKMEGMGVNEAAEALKVRRVYGLSAADTRFRRSLPSFRSKTGKSF